MAQSPTAALLYLPQSCDFTLLRLIDQIKADPILSKGIRIISVDNPDVKNLLQENESGIVVNKLPVFAVRFPEERAPTLYPLSSSSKVFELIHPPPIQHQVRDPLNESSSDRVINWNLDLFSEGPISMVVSEGSRIRFVSDDDLIHDVTLTDSTWKPLRRLIPRQKKMNQELMIDQQLLKTIERGRCYFISSLPQDRQMRLVLRLLNPIDEIINGISEVESTNEFIRDDLTSSREKSGSDGFRTNPLIARVQVPQIEEVPRTTFAQLRLAKLE